MKTSLALPAATGRRSLILIFILCAIALFAAPSVANPPPGGGGGPGGAGPGLPAVIPGDPAYLSGPGAPVIILPTDPGWPATPFDPVVIFPSGPGAPVYIWPGDPDYPVDDSYIVIYPGDPNYPGPAIDPGGIVIIWPGDPDYPIWPVFPWDPIIVYPGNPGWPLLPGDPIFPGAPIIVWPGDPGYPTAPGNPITVQPGDPGYPPGFGGGNPPPGDIGLPGFPGYGGDPPQPGNGITPGYGGTWGGAAAPDGHNPTAGAILGTDGFLYGTTSTAGPNGAGIVWRTDTSGNNYSILHAFNGTDGSDPEGELAQVGSLFYGTTNKGGAYNRGVLYAVSAAGTFGCQYSFWNFTGGAPSSSDSVNLASGVEENSPGPDILGRNPIGPSAVYSRYYRSVLAANGYASPGLSVGWTDNYDITVQGVSGAWTQLTLQYPNGAREKWTPVFDANNSTGSLTPSLAGAPYIAAGVPSPNGAGQWIQLTVTWGDHSFWTFEPAPNNPNLYLLTRLTNAVGRSAVVQYDGSQFITSVTNDANPPLTLLSFAYSGGALSSITDPYGRQVNFTFAQIAGVSCLTAVSQLNSTSAQWQYGYTPVNGWTFLNSVGVPDPTGGGGIRTHPITYAPDGRVASLVDANGNQRVYSYTGNTSVQILDSHGNPVQNWAQASGSLNNDLGTTDANHNSDEVSYSDPANPYAPTGYQNRNNQMVSATYDKFGNVESTTAPCSGGQFTTLYSYSYANFGLGQLMSTSLPTGDQTSFTYYANGLVETVTGTAPGVNWIAPVVTYYYTALGNISAIVAPGPNTTGAMVTTRYNYVFDPLDGTQQPETLGQPLTVTDPMGAVTHLRWDARGNCIARITPMLERTDFVYNIADQLISTILPPKLANGPRAHVDTIYMYVGGPALSTTAYDDTGAAVRTAGETLGKEGEGLASTGSTERSSEVYDGEGRVSQLKDGNNNAFQHGYDAVGNLNQLSYPLGDTVHGQFDADGNLTRYTNGRGQNQAATLAADDSRVTSVMHDSGVNEVVQYDFAGRVTQVSDGSTTLSYIYDQLSNVVSVSTVYAGANNAGEMATGYSYNIDGSRSAMQSNAELANYTRDLDGRVTDIQYNWTVGHLHFTYDLDGRIIDKRTTYTDVAYSYNGAGQLVSLTNTALPGGGFLISQYSGMTYDGAGNLLHESLTTLPLAEAGGPNTTGTLAYSFDSQDRVTGEASQRNIVGAGTGLLGNYTYASASDAADNLTMLRGVAQASNANNQLVTDGINGVAYSYDQDGNPTQEEGRSLQYDDSGHLIQYDDNPANIHLLMGYRPDGLRAWRQVNGGPRTYFFYDGATLLYEETQNPNPSYPANVTRVYGWGPTGLEQTSAGVNATTTYVFDPQGGVSTRIDVNGQLIDQAFYDAFGQLGGDWTYNYYTWGGGRDSVSWGGQWGAYTDIDTAVSGQPGLILLTHRYYNPDTGRFLTRDPTGYEGGINIYAYTRNNPVMRSDPTGLQSVDSLSSNFFAALRAAKDLDGLKDAAFFLRQIGMKSVVYQRCLAALLASRPMQQAIQAQVVRLQGIAGPVSNLAGGNCAYIANAIKDVLVEHEVEVFEMTPTKPLTKLGEDGIELAGETTHWGHHYFVRVGNMVMDAVNHGVPETFEKWSEHFVTPKWHWWWFTRQPIDTYYKFKNVTGEFQYGD